MAEKGLKTAYCVVLAMLLGLFSVTAHAVDPAAVDYAANGSISVSIHEMGTQTPVEDASLALYYVGTLEDTGFVKTDNFAGFEGDITDFDNKKLALSLEAYIRENQVDCLLLCSADDTGKIRFEDLPVGLYLLVQPSHTATHVAAEPFLVSLPMTDPVSGKLSYQIDANPKVGPVPTVTPGVPTQTPTPTPRPTTPPRLPQTGMLLWPVPVLGGIGLVLFVVGWIMRRRSWHEE